MQAMKANTRVVAAMAAVLAAVAGCQDDGESTGSASFETSCGGDYWDAGRSVVETADGGFVIAGDFGTGINRYSIDGYLVKIDSSGVVVWQRRYGVVGGQDDCDGADCVIRNADGSFVVAGGTGMTVLFGRNSKMWLFKTDANGGLLWEKSYEGNGNSWASSVAGDSDGGYVIAGHGLSYRDGPMEQHDAYLVKTDANGDQVWERTYGGDGDDYANDVARTADGGFIVAGEMEAADDNTDAYLVKTDASGQVVWERSYGDTGIERAIAVEERAGGGYIVAGDTGSEGVGGSDIWLFCTDASGVLLWSRTFGGAGDDSCGSLAATPDGGYLVTGTLVEPDGSQKLLMVKTDAGGNAAWQRTFGAGGRQEGLDGIATSGGGYLAVGTTRAENVIYTDLYAVKTQ